MNGSAKIYRNIPCIDDGSSIGTTPTNNDKGKKNMVEVENRVGSLEKAITTFESEIKMINRTMSDVATTLKEIKDDQKRIQKFEVEKAMLERDIAEIKDKMNTFFKKFDGLKEDMAEVKEANAASAVKLGNAERVTWIIITGAIGALSIFSKG